MGRTFFASDRFRERDDLDKWCKEILSYSLDNEKGPRKQKVLIICGNYIGGAYTTLLGTSNGLNACMQLLRVHDSYLVKAILITILGWVCWQEPSIFMHQRLP